ncbi:MAG: FAD-dependent oxidoreductase [Deltaproteobacteria bacterium]|nr:FAD-dependent oxidoreductase [Deltaproteobacteria bacterium]
MKRMFNRMDLGGMDLVNRFMFPPIKLAYGNPDGTVTNRQLLFYGQLAQNGPGLLILEPVSVTPDGKEHPKQLCVHLPDSVTALRKITDVIHDQGRLACLHLNHAGAAANPTATKTEPKAPSPLTCPSSGQTSKSLTEEEIKIILDGYRRAAERAVEAGFDAIEVQAGHGYLVSQFMNSKINKRTDRYGEDRLLFARDVLEMVREGAEDIPIILRVSGSEMSPEFGISREDLLPLLSLAVDKGICAIHVGMGNSCFSPPWYFHHTSLPDAPQWEALSWMRENTQLPLIVAGRMGRTEKILQVLDKGVGDLVALGRPLIADPDLLEKWRKGLDAEATLCGYCLQGCLHRVRSGEGLGCNVNPAIALPGFKRSESPMKILVAGGGPAGMSAARYLSLKGHKVTLVEKEDQLGGQFRLAWQAPGKKEMKETLDSFERSLLATEATILTGREVDAALVEDINPDLLVWATGALQNIPEIEGLEKQHRLTSIEYFKGLKDIKGPRVLIIGAGRTGLEIAEKLGKEGYVVVATKRTDPIGSMMEMITKNLTLKRIGEMENVILMPHTTVKAFLEDSVDIEQDRIRMSLEPFQTVIIASGMNPSPGPAEEIRKLAPGIEIIGDAREALDIYSAMRAGYELATKY